ncbi:MAG: hypothetical protein FWG68_03125 [Defluviitaleaceae bacterium]|nr:hypothetical protein [Defluviitaleaceae bacterium]
MILAKNEHSQQFPDFSANINGKNYDMEVKCWNYENSPAFDIANFERHKTAKRQHFWQLLRGKN